MTTEITPSSEQQQTLPRRPHLLRSLLISASLAALLAGASLPYFIYPAHNSAAAAPAANLPDFTDLVARVKPAVFSVQVKIDPSRQLSQDSGEEQQAPTPFNGENPFKGTPFEHFFDGAPQFGAPNSRPQIVQGLGSGFFISADGYAVTNNHVVDGATEVKIVIDDGKTYQAKVVGSDPKTDLSLLKVQGGSDFPYVKLAQKSPRIGEWVLAVGNPFGLGGTVTAGIVSAEKRDIGSGPYDDFIQIDAPVNRGNSGGPTFNMEGEVIGVNTAIYSPSGGSVGIAFDIPATTVNEIVPVLREKGHIERGWLGVQIQPVTEDIAQSLGLAEAKGALVDRPEAGGPGEKAGLKPGDVIAKVNGATVADARDLARKIGSLAPHTQAELSVIRDGKEQAIHLTLGAMKDSQKQAQAQTEDNGESDKLGKLGLSVAPASTIAGAGRTGIVVTDIDPDGAAASSGVETGDIILKIGNRDVGSVRELRQALADTVSKGRDKALALVRRGNEQHYVALPAKASLS